MITSCNRYYLILFFIVFAFVCASISVDIAITYDDDKISDTDKTTILGLGCAIMGIFVIFFGWNIFKTTTAPDFLNTSSLSSSFSLISLISLDYFGYTEVEGWFYFVLFALMEAYGINMLLVYNELKENNEDITPYILANAIVFTVIGTLALWFGIASSKARIDSIKGGSVVLY